SWAGSTASSTLVAVVADTGRCRSEEGLSLAPRAAASLRGRPAPGLLLGASARGSDEAVGCVKHPVGFLAVHRHVSIERDAAVIRAGTGVRHVARGGSEQRIVMPGIDLAAELGCAADDLDHHRV